MAGSSGRLIRVERIDAFLTPSAPHVPVILCHLEGDKQFALYYVPYEIVLALNRYLNSFEEPSTAQRESIFDLLTSFTSFIDEIKRTLIRVVIDELNKETMLYTATAEFSVGRTVVRRKMIPSHAIFLAVITDKPIYVSEALVEHQEYMSQLK